MPKSVSSRLGMPSVATLESVIGAGSPASVIESRSSRDRRSTARRTHCWRHAASTQKRSCSKRFEEWLELKKRASTDAARAYEAILAIKDAASSITVAARLAVIVESFASSLVTPEIPRAVRTGGNAKVKAYCDAMLDVA